MRSEHLGTGFSNPGPQSVASGKLLVGYVLLDNLGAGLSGR